MICREVRRLSARPGTKKRSKNALSQAALHSEVARNQTGEARENSLKEAEAWRSAFNQLSGKIIHHPMLTVLPG
jgi:conjugal transfer mating pair stabilization protein TraG